MADVVEDVENASKLAGIAADVKALCDQFPAPGIPVTAS
jgi:hypothetical protein